VDFCTFCLYGNNDIDLGWKSNRKKVKYFQVVICI
jgi:hypothetical protein